MAARDLDNLDFQGPGDPDPLGALIAAIAGGDSSPGRGGYAPELGGGRLNQSPGGFDYSGRGSYSGGQDSPGGGAPTPSGDRFSRGMEWLGADIANNGSGRLDRAAPYGAGGGFAGAGNPKEPPGQGDPYASTVAMDPFARAMNRFEDNTEQNYFGQSPSQEPPAPPMPGGPQNNYAGPSVPLGGPGAPVSPFMSENNAFTALNAQNAAQAAAAAAPPLPPEPLSSMFGDVKGGLIPSAPPAPPMPGGADLRQFIGQLLGGLGSNPRPTQPSGGGANYPQMGAQGIPGMPSLFPITGFQGAGLNRQVPGSVRNSSIADFIIKEEPFLNSAMNPPEPGMPALAERLHAMRATGPQPQNRPRRLYR